MSNGIPSTQRLPMISIITPCFNRAKLVLHAIKSVLVQDYPNFEHIIIDGGSTDGTLDVLGKYPHLRLISELDHGMYDAINKGLALASGEIIGFLNTDDLYADDIFTEVAKKFIDDRILAVAGGAVIFYETPEGMPKIIGKFSPKTINLLELSTIGSPFFNAWFFRKSLFGRIGNFKTNYRIAADKEFMLRLALSGLKYTTLNKIVYQYRHHAGSLTFDIDDQKLEQIVKEHIEMTNSYLQMPDLPRQARILIRQLRTRDTLEMAVRATRQRDLRRMFFYMTAGTRYDLKWSIKLGQRTVKFLFKKARESFRLSGD